LKYLKTFDETKDENKEFGWKNKIKVFVSQMKNKSAIKTLLKVKN